MGQKIARQSIDKRTNNSLNSRVVIPDEIYRYQILDAGMPRQKVQTDTTVIQSDSMLMDTTTTANSNNNSNVGSAQLTDSVDQFTSRFDKEDDDLAKRLNVIADFLASQPSEFTSIPSVLEQFNREQLDDSN